MDSSASIHNRIFINADADASSKRATLSLPEKSTDPQTSSIPAKRNDPIIKYGNPESVADAQAMFSRANSYADLSSSIKKGLQAYESIDMSERQEALKQLMGVDIYA